MPRDYSNVKAHNGASVPAKSDNVMLLGQMLAQNMTAIKSALPKHLTGERVARVALNTIRRNPKLCKCVPQTLCAAIMEASSLGLEIDMRGQAYLVPFWNGKTNTHDVQLIIGYKGLMDIVYRSGAVKQFYADVVGENDTFDVELGLNPNLVHRPNLRGRGEIIAAYAIAVMADGSKQFVVMRREELDKVRDASKSKDDGPWKSWPEEMQKKTAIKRLCKLLPLSPVIQKAITLDDQADAGNEQQFDYEVEVISPAPDTAEAQPAPAPEIKGETKEEKAEPQPKQDDYLFECPKNSKKITEEQCKDCKDRPGCPQWEAM